MIFHTGADNMNFSNCVKMKFKIYAGRNIQGLNMQNLLVEMQRRMKNYVIYSAKYTCV